MQTHRVNVTKKMRPSIDEDSDNTISFEASSDYEDDGLLSSISAMDEVRTASGWSQATPRILDITDKSWELKRSQINSNQERIQFLLFWSITLLNIGLMIISLFILFSEPLALQDFLFHGIVGPSQLIQIFVGFASTFYGGFALYKREVEYDKSRAWFRRYHRNNKLFLLNWVISTSTCVYGCWKFNMIYAEDIEYNTLRKLQKYYDEKYSPFIVDILIGVNELLWALRDQGVTFKAAPFPLIFGMGKNPWLAAFFLVIIPSAVIGAAIWFQHRFYMMKYFQISKN
jgi:hypothetical protein